MKLLLPFFVILSFCGFAQTKAEVYFSPFVYFLINQDFYINNDKLLDKKFEYSDGFYGIEDISIFYTIPNNDKVNWYFKYQLDDNCKMKVKELTLFWEDQGLYNDMLDFCNKRNMLKESVNEYCNCDYIYTESNVSYIFKKDKSIVILIK